MFALIAAAHTPFDADGKLALDVVEQQATHLRAVGVDGVLLAGSTGEGPSLTHEERRRLAERWSEVCGPLRVMVQVGHDSVAEAILLARHAAQIGASAICSAPPSWFPITETGQLADTCAAIANAAPELPFYYYHIPALSNVHVPMAPWLDVVRPLVPNFKGIKYTHLDKDDFAACVRDHGDAIELLWGCDEKLLDGLDAGAHGAVGSSYSFAAPVYHALLEAHRSGDRATAEAMQSRSVQLIDLLARRGYAASAKATMKLLGVDCGPVRLPLQRVDETAEAELRSNLEHLGFFDWIESGDD